MTNSIRPYLDIATRLWNDEVGQWRKAFSAERQHFLVEFVRRLLVPAGLLDGYLREHAADELRARGKLSSDVRLQRSGDFLPEAPSAPRMPWLFERSRRMTSICSSPNAIPMVGTVVHEKGWFADDAGVIIGAVTFDVTDEDWGYVVLESDEDGLFRGIDVEVSLLSREEATT
jgi:hypothetical protein